MTTRPPQDPAGLLDLTITLKRHTFTKIIGADDLTTRRIFTPREGLELTAYYIDNQGVESRSATVHTDNNDVWQNLHNALLQLRK